MRHLTLACALALAACASPQKPVPQAARPIERAVVGKAGDRIVSFVVDGAWAPMAKDGGDSDVIVLTSLDDPKSAVAVYFQEADLGSTVEEATTRWAVMMLSIPTLFTATDVTKPEYASETESTFTISGMDGKTPMVSKCRIIELGDPTADYWVAIFSVSPISKRGPAFDAVDKIAKTLRLEPRNPSK